MGFSDASILLKLSSILSAVVTIVLTVGISTTAWLTVSNGENHVYQGLFKACGSYRGIFTCVDMGIEVLDWVHATRAFVIIGVLVSIGLTGVLVVSVFVKNDMKILKTVAIVLAFVTAGFVIIGVIIYGAKSVFDYQISNTTISAKLGWSFGLTTAAGIAFIIIGVVLLVEKTRG